MSAVHGGRHVGNVASILTAVATSGIVFSYNGFQSPVNLAGEARNPGRSVPFAIFGSIALSTVVYLLLQVAFLGAVAPDHLQRGLGRAGIQLAVRAAGAGAEPQLAGDPAVCRCLRQPERHRHHLHRHHRAHDLRHGAQRHACPQVFGRVHPRYGIPRPAMWFNLVVSFIFLFFFRGWGKLAAVISVATIITYLVVPISVMVLRRTAPEPAPAAARAGSAGAGAAGLRARHADAVLGALAAYRRDHAAADSAACRSTSTTRRKAGWRDFGRQLRACLVADRVPC